MKSIASVIAFCSLFLSAGQTPGNRAPSLQPTPLEAFASQPVTHIAWSKEVGRLDSREAQAVVTALILEDTAQPPDRMRGIRIDLSRQDSKDEVYLGEETLGAYKNALDEISQDTPSFRNRARDDVAPGGTGCLGAGLFWYGDNVPRVHSLNAAYCIDPDSEGLALSAFKNRGFEFPDLDASQLSTTIARAMELLKNR
jgi:hypothetical protein